jgi:membrane protein DedA with SNARE-associated domain
MAVFQHITQLVNQYGYFILYPIAVLEGPIISIIAGFMASKGLLDGFAAYLILVLGDTTGDILYYLLGRFGGYQFVKRWGERIGLSKKRMDAVDRHFIHHGGKTLLFGKWTQTVGAPILVTAGMLRMKFAKYMWYNTLGTLPKSLVLLLLGYYFGTTYDQWSKYLDIISWAALGVVVLGFIIYYFRKKST